ncbi:hypothetical protein Aau02nite_35020 [Amorphoplanes auranticolor]|uniref:Uncharacterized protein n=1 Tax=Actinoplanes auranticolor TaxID=47988 RepID=A0A919VMT3_9ACTN|nr:hypothetical protein Aau02nite_35020 [Actinoplanes auranticolor]
MISHPLLTAAVRAGDETGAGAAGAALTAGPGTDHCPRDGRGSTVEGPRVAGSPQPVSRPSTSITAQNRTWSSIAATGPAGRAFKN